MNLCRGRRMDEFLSIGHIRIENGNFSGDFFSQIFHHNFNDFLQALFKLTKKTIRKDSHKPQGGTKIHQIFSHSHSKDLSNVYFFSLFN